MEYIFIDNIISGVVPLKYIQDYSKIPTNFGIIEYDNLSANELNNYINYLINKFYNNTIKLQPKKIINRYIRIRITKFKKGY